MIHTLKLPSLFLISLLLIYRCAFGQDSQDPVEWKPEIPRTWQDRVMADIEVPLARPEYSPRHVSQKYYYSIPEMTIYKSYPVYHPDHEPEGYWEWLHRQQPEVIFDSKKLHTKQDWINAGENVFLDGDFTTGLDLDMVRDRETYKSTGIRLTAKGENPYVRYVIRKRGEVGLSMFSCAGCHTRVFDDGTLIRGGPGNNPLGAIMAEKIRRQLKPEDLRKEPSVDRDSVDYRFAAAPWISPDPGNYAIGLSEPQLAAVSESLIPGVFVRNRTSYQHPVRIPDLIGLEKRKYFDATGLVQHRSIGDLMRYEALQAFDELASFDGFIPGADDFKNLPDPATWERISDPQLYALALYLYSLESPANPNQMTEAAGRGKKLFRSNRCVTCHNPPNYTNNRLVSADGFKVPPEHRKRFNVSSRQVGTNSGLTLKTRRGTGYYKVPTLRGVWYRGPFFHDGSLAKLEDVFDPSRLDKDYVPTGFRGPGGKKRSVPGHTFGLDLPASDRADLIEFLKTL